MYRLFVYWLVLCAAVLASPAASAQDDQTEASNQAQWLLVIHGDVAVASETELVLVTEPRAVAFTDRPERQARVLDTTTVIEDAWADDSSFRLDPPNVAVADEDNDRTAVITVDDVAMRGAVLTLSIEVLEGQMPGVGDHVVLTIDGVQIHFGPNPGDG